MDHPHCPTSSGFAVGRAGDCAAVSLALCRGGDGGLYPLTNGAIYPSIGIDSRSGLWIVTRRAAVQLEVHGALRDPLSATPMR